VRLTDRFSFLFFTLNATDLLPKGKFLKNLSTPQEIGSRDLFYHPQNQQIPSCNLKNKAIHVEFCSSFGSTPHNIALLNANMGKLSFPKNLSTPQEIGSKDVSYYPQSQKTPPVNLKNKSIEVVFYAAFR